MKILILVHQLTDGGSERVASLWAKGFYEDGNTVSILLKEEGLPITYQVPEGVKIIPLKLNRNNYSKYIRYVLKLILLRKIIKDSEADVIISIDPKLSRAAYLVTRGLGVPIIHTAHNAFERPEGVKMALSTRIEKFLYNRFYDKVTLLTEADKRIIGSRLKNTTVLPNPLAYKPAEKYPEKKKVVLAAGRLDYWHYKGFDLLLKAWEKLGKEKGEWTLVIAGSSRKGTGISFLTNMASDLNVSNSVKFIGYQSDMLPYYKDAAIYVLSSRYEGFGMVLIEAMSQGCACIAADYKGRQGEIITHNADGLLFKPEDVEGLTEALKNLLNDSEKRKRIGQAAISRSEYYSVANTTKRWYNIFKEMNILG